MARGYGRYGQYPRTYGGGESILETEHLALLDALSPGWDVSEGTEIWAECYAHAQILSFIWACNLRLKNQALPLRMLENLRTWEQCTALRPSPHDSDNTRRRALAAKLRGIAGNTLGDIIDVCSTSMGSNFVQIVPLAASSVQNFWPGGPALATGYSSPGPPGYEFSSNRCHITVEVNASGIALSVFRSKRASLIDALDLMLPAWMTFTVGIDAGGFIVNQGIFNRTLL